MEKSTRPTDEVQSTASIPLRRDPNKKIRLGRLALKELRETLRDRRTIITLILMPILVYPILSLVFRTFLAANAGLFGTGEPVVLQIAYGGAGPEKQTKFLVQQLGGVIEVMETEQLAAAKSSTATQDEVGSDTTGKNSSGLIAAASVKSPFVRFKEHSWLYVSNDEDRSIHEIVESGEADVGLYFRADDENQFRLGEVALISRNDQISRATKKYMQQKIDVFNERMRKNLLRRARLPTDPALSTVDEKIGTDDESTSARGGVSLASLIPLILVLMTITGAVYPAIDLTAGEKERGTLETLMAAPIPRVSILIAKFFAVLTVAVLTALLNMIGMAATVWAFRLDQFLTGAAEFSPIVVFKIFLLLILFAAFFSAVLLAVTSYARSFKEAQAYLIPIILLSLGPGLLAMTPGLSLTGIWALIPMVNILLLARDVIQNQVVLAPAFVAIVSTVAYAACAILFAARTFGSDSILYSTHGSFGEMFARPMKTQIVVPLAATVFCLVLLFPINFILIGLLGRLPAETPSDLSVRFLLMGVFTIFSFLVFPYLVARHQRTKIGTGFGVKPARLVFYLCAVLLGVSLWPIVTSLLEGWHEVYGWLAGTEQRDAWHARLVEETSKQVIRVRQVSPALIALCLSLIPAICEEWFFRGMLQRSLLKINKPSTAILLSAVVFGLFHVLSNSVIALDRLVPTTLVGIVLGYLAYKSDSILPCIILHALHNAAVSFLAYFQPQLSQYEWFPAESDPIPFQWVAVAIVVAAVGLLLLVKSRRDSRELDSSKHHQVAEIA